MPARAAAGASRGAFSNVDAKKNRMAPYTAGTRGKGKPGCITEEEVETLVKLDEAMEEIKEKTQEATDKLKTLKRKQRDELDACKRENRGGKLNGPEIERVKELGREKVEEVRVVMSCRITDDKAAWTATNDDPEQKEQQAKLESALLEATELYNKEKAALDTVLKRKHEVESEVGRLHASIKELEAAEIEINTSTAQLEASRAMLEAKKDTAQRDVMQKEEVVSKVVAQQADTCSQLENATNERKQMEAKVSKLSNNIKGGLWLTGPCEKVEVSGLKGTEVKIDKKMTFELDSVSVGDMPLGELVGTAMHVYVSTQQGMVPLDVERCLEYGLKAVPGAVVTACEIYNDSLRDLLKDNVYQELSLVQPDVLLDSFDKLTAVPSPDPAAIISSYRLRAAKTQVRAPTTLYFSFKAPSSSTGLHIFCAPHLSKTEADASHILNPFIKMYSDAKEAKQMMKRTNLGRQVSHTLAEANKVSIIGIGNEQTTAQGVTDVCRLIHRCMMVDLGVRKE